MSKTKKRKIVPFLFFMGVVILLVLFVLFFIMKKNNTQQEERIVSIDLNNAATQSSPLSETVNVDVSLDAESLPTLSPTPPIDGAVGMTALTLGAPPEKIADVSSKQAEDKTLRRNDKVASVSVNDGVVRFYFALDKANVADGSRNALDRLINEAKGRRYLVIAPIYEEAEKNLLDDKLLQQRVLSIWKILEDAGVSAEKRIILKPQAQEPGDDNYVAGVHIDVFSVQGDHYPAEDLWSISVPAQ